MDKLKVLSLFAGIGGFDLGLERAGGFESVAFCEIDPFCQKVLAKHWPNVPCHSDVRELSGDQVGAVDVICGGFPCQDLSFAGRGAGIAGARSGLWKEYARLVGELLPTYIIVENSPALLIRGMQVVLGDLAEIGYDAEWHCIPASHFGAPHHRDRLWIIARRRAIGRNSSHTLQANEIRKANSGITTFFNEIGTWISKERISPFFKSWSPKPRVDSVVDGLSAKMDKHNGAYGNAVIPQIPEMIGNAILEDIGWQSN